MRKPYEHQRFSINQIKSNFKEVNRVLFTLGTGGGKTFCFSTLINEFLNEFGVYKKAIVCVDKEELLEQAAAAINSVGLSCELVTAKKRKLSHSCDVYVCMIETAFNRLKRNKNFFKPVDLIVIDEAHILKFDKIFDFFPEDQKILGCTATPVTMKRINYFKCDICSDEYFDGGECCGVDLREWVRPFSLSLIYDRIVVGKDVPDLIDDGKLVKEVAFKKEVANIEKLEEDKNSESGFTAESIDEVYSDADAVFNVVLNYEEICKGKRTLIFNANTKVNQLVYEQFLDSGYTTKQVKIYDSVNENTEDRKSIINWFKNTPDAILLNVACFTTGLDVPTLEAVIVNRAIGSLSLWIQIAGRGGRTTTDIYKDHFILIDGGGNIDRFGLWSDRRDWEAYFYGSDKNNKPKARREEIEHVNYCDTCGYLKGLTESVCPNCGEIMKGKTPKVKEQFESNEVLKAIEIPSPDPRKIYEYTKAKNQDLNFAWRILINQIVDLFKYYRIQKQTYISTLENGNFDKRINAIIRKNYFFLKDTDLESGTYRTLNYFNKQIVIKLNKFYGIG